MKYLFFDTECANCFNGVGKICEFGYVLLDENFEIIKKHEFIMSPGRGRENRFYLENRKGHKDLKLSYDPEYYYDEPEFPTFYDEIRKLMEDEDTITFAWSSDNDILHLYNTCKRYKKKPFKYTCYDVQKMVMEYLNSKNQMALDVACQRIVGVGSRVHIQEHLSSDDALMTQMIFSKLCELLKKSTKELLDDSEYAKDESLEFIDRFVNKKETKAKHAKKIEEFNLAIEPDIDKKMLKEYFGKRYDFTSTLKQKYDNLNEIIDDIHSNGGIVINDSKNADIFVCYNDEDISRMKDIFKDRFDGNYITVQDLFKK